MINKSKIAIVTTVISRKLYTKTASLFPKGIDKYIIDGTNGMYGLESINYMFRKFENKKYDWIIMADEDVFFYEADLVFDIIKSMLKNDFSICGVRDGGVIKHRYHNPEAINTFFSIINFRDLKGKYNLKEIKSFQNYTPELYKNKNYSQLPHCFDIKSMREPYYCFYFWAHHNNYKFLYLDTINPVGDDEVGNVILSPSGEKIAMHSWYARAYGVFDDQTLRLNNFIEDFDIVNAAIDWNEVILLKNYFFNWKKRLKRLLKQYK
jgi:hypothetical protein